MKYFKLKFKDGTEKIVKAETIKELIRQYDLTTKEHINTRIIELQGEQLAIAISNDEN